MSSILSTKTKTFQEKIKNAPLTPGCYLYKDKDGHVIYVGKAKILRNRVKSYFNNFSKLEIDKQDMISISADIEYVTVDTEIEALILETNLIKKYKTKYNVLMRDGKSYVYVKFEKVRKSNQAPPTRDSVYQDFPRIKIVRQKFKDGAEYFGPYPDTMPAKRLLVRLRRVFPYRTTNNLVYVKYEEKNNLTPSPSPSKMERGDHEVVGEVARLAPPIPYIYTSDPKPCFYCHIGLCLGACSGRETKEAYLKRFNEIKRFFRGEKFHIQVELENKIKEASKKLNYEKAAELRDKLNDIKYVTANIRIGSDTDDVIIEQIKKDKKGKGLNELVNSLGFPDEKLSLKNGLKIECYDISNIQGKNAVGSMVVMVDGEIKPELYRRFKIRMKNEPNDFGMLQEVFRRRFAHVGFGEQPDGADYNPRFRDPVSQNIDPSFSVLPNLIIVDGGKGQLASTYRILYEYNLHNTVPIVGLAKKEEEIYKLTDQFKTEFNQINDSDMFKKIKLPRKSEGLYLVQRIRDEAHRFAITYHRNLRSKAMLNKK